MFFLLFSGVLNPDKTPKQPLQELLKRDGQKSNASVGAYTQQNWMRPPGIERPHIKKKETHIVNRKFILLKLKTLGMLEPVMPSKKTYTYVVFHGAYTQTMENRIKFCKGMCSHIQYKQIVFLTGQRFLDSDKEKETLTLGLKTEYDAAKYLMQKHGFHNALIINAIGKNNAPRPNTQDTVEEWRKTNPATGTVLAISNNPYIQRQDLILKNLLGSEFDIETIGDSAPDNINISVLLDELARLIYTELRS